MSSLSFSTGSEALQNADRLVVKIGGENASFFQENYENTRKRIEQGQKIVLAVSALRGPRGAFNTTSELQNIAALVAQKQETSGSVARITRFAIDAVIRDSEQLCASQKISRQFQGFFLRHMQKVIMREGAICQSYLHEAVRKGVKPLRLGADALLPISSREKYFSITGWGERLAETMYREYFTQRGVPAATLPTDTLPFDAYRSDPYHILLEPKAKHAALERMRVHVRSAIADTFWSQGSSLIIASGYFPLLAAKRGYSDTGAAFIAQAVQEACGDVVCLIRKQFPVMKVDPRSIAQPLSDSIVSHLTFEEAEEAMREGGSAAGGIHPHALTLLKQRKIPTVVGSTYGEENGSLTLVM